MGLINLSAHEVIYLCSVAASLAVYLLAWKALKRARASHERTERELLESRALVQDMFQSSRAVHLLIDPRDGAIVNVNAAACAFYGYDRAALMALRIWDINQLGEAATRQRMQRAIGGDQTAFVFEHRLASGEIRTVEVYSAPLIDGGRKLLSSIVIDVTDRKRAEDQLRESRERFTNAFEYAAIGMALVSPEGRWLKVNRAVCEMLGYSEWELLDRTFQALTHPDDLPADQDNVRRMLVGDISTYRMEKRYFHKSGRLVWALLNVSLVRDSGGRPLYFISQVIDISAQKESERQRAMALEVLDILNETREMSKAASRILDVIRRETGVEAAAIRLARGNDFNYFVHTGFPREFIEAEDRLCCRNEDGSVPLGPDGKPFLECTCGLVLRGRTDPASPLFSPGGSAWANDPTLVTAIPAGQDPRFRPRNNCIHSGYKSIAIIPIRSGAEIVGLLQLNDHAPDRFSPETIAFLEGVAGSIGIALARWQSAKQLRDNIEHLSLAHDAANAGTWEWNLKTHENVWADSIWRLYGLDPARDKASYETWLRVIHPEDRDRIDQTVKAAAATGEELKAEWRVCLPDGSQHWMMSRGRPVRDEDGQIDRYMGVVIDVTDRKEAEERLRQSEEQFMVSFKSNPAWLSMVDISSTHILEVNDAWTKLFGFTREEVLGRSIVELGLADESTYRNVMEEARQGVFSRNVETSVRLRNGDMCVLLVSRQTVYLRGKPCLLTMGLDITDRRKAEAERVELKAAVEQASDGIAMSDLDGLVGYVNSAWLAMHGCDLEAVKGRPLSVFHTPEQLRQEVAPHLAHLMEQGHHSGEIHHLRKDGTIFPTWMSTSILRDGFGKPTGLLAICQDITQRKQEQEAQAQLQAQLAQAQKMESIGRLAGGVAHDFNNSMFCVLGFSDLILEDLEASSPFLPQVKQIRMAAQQAADLTKQLLAFSRKQIIQPRPTNLDSLILHHQTMLRHVIGADIRITLNLQSEQMLAVVDPSQFQQVLLNLCINARDAMPAGGELVIESKVVRDVARAGLPAGSGTVFVCVSVVDRGGGIPPEVLSRIFEPFFTTKEAGKGTGLGLSVVLGIVQQHGGWIDVSSEPGRGSRFDVYFPRAEAAAEPPADEQASLVRGAGELILLVEDAEAVRAMAATMLRGLGYRLIEADSVEAGLREFRSAKEPIRVLFSDVVLPDGNGITLADEISKADRSVRIVLSSGYTDERSLVGEIQKRRWTFMPKPYTKQQVGKLLHALLN